MTKPNHFCEVNDLEPFVNSLQDIRHRIHQNPEMAYEEFETASLVADYLSQWGYQVTTGVGGTGVVGTLKLGSNQKSIGIRADMDALPIQENTGLSYASIKPGTMHACGHDGHTTMLLGAARYLAATRNFSGTLQLYFQPAEERGFDSGAKRMVEDGLFERFPCDAVFGIHNHPGVAPGTFMFRSGPFMSASDKVIISIYGNGGHAARPHLCIDPIIVGSNIVLALQTIVSRNIDPIQPAVITVGSFNSGIANNVIPASATLELSVRSFNEKVRAQLRERIEALVHAQAKSYGATAEIIYQEGYPLIDNDAKETAFAIDVARELVGENSLIVNADMMMTSEDFAYMLQKKPGCFLRLGNGIGESGCPVHNPKYDFNDLNLPIGAAYWARLVERFLAYEDEI